MTNTNEYDDEDISHLDFDYDVVPVDENQVHVKARPELESGFNQ